jgi:phosphoribosylamine-glycine ligase
VLLPLLESDLFEVINSCVDHVLDSVDVKFKENCSAVTVVLASNGYPGKFLQKNEISYFLRKLYDWIPH